MKNNLQIVKTGMVLGLGLLLGSALVSLAASSSSWVTPPSTPPDCPLDVDGCNPPLNTGATNQVKSGGLKLGASSYFGIVDMSKMSIGFDGVLDPAPQAAGAQLEVRGGKIQATDGLKLPTSAANGTAADGAVLVSDASGNAKWGTASGGGATSQPSLHAINEWLGNGCSGEGETDTDMYTGTVTDLSGLVNLNYTRYCSHILTTPQPYNYCQITAQSGNYESCDITRNPSTKVDAPGKTWQGLNTASHPAGTWSMFLGLPNSDPSTGGGSCTMTCFN